MYAISIPNLVEIRKVNLNSLLISPGMTQILCKVLCYGKQLLESYETLSIKKLVKICILTWRVFAEPVTIMKHPAGNFKLLKDEY